MVDPSVVEGLLPCPFCGEADWLKIEASCYVHCRSCCADGPVLDNHSDDADFNAETAKLWNTRATPPSPEGVEEIIAAVKPLVDAALGLSLGTDWNNGTMAKKHGYRRKLIEALPKAADAILRLSAAPPSVECSRGEG